MALKHASGKSQDQCRRYLQVCEVQGCTLNPYPVHSSMKAHSALGGRTKCTKQVQQDDDIDAICVSAMQSSARVTWHTHKLGWGQ